MPLRDHFKPPLIDRKSWDGFHGQWPAMIVLGLSQSLPERYAAAPNVHLGSSIEIDVGTFEEEDPDFRSTVEGSGDVGIATALWAPPEPSMSFATDLLDMDEYEVLVYDNHRNRRLVAAIEIVSPSNKDRPEHRRAFVAKCAGLLKDHVSVMIIDLVTTRSANLHVELLDFLDERERKPPIGNTPLYASVCRWVRRNDQPLLETWMQPLTIGQPLPTLPLWLSLGRAIPLELEASYEETCRVLRIA